APHGGPPRGEANLRPRGGGTGPKGEQRRLSQSRPRCRGGATSDDGGGTGGFRTVPRGWWHTRALSAHACPAQRHGGDAVHYLFGRGGALACWLTLVLADGCVVQHAFFGLAAGRDAEPLRFTTALTAKAAAAEREGPFSGASSSGTHSPFFPPSHAATVAGSGSPLEGSDDGAAATDRRTAGRSANVSTAQEAPAPSGGADPQRGEGNGAAVLMLPSDAAVSAPAPLPPPPASEPTRPAGEESSAAPVASAAPPLQSTPRSGDDDDDDIPWPPPPPAMRSGVVATTVPSPSPSPARVPRSQLNRGEGTTQARLTSRASRASSAQTGHGAASGRHTERSCGASVTRP
ncbi:mucin-1-like, partial [Bactrocera neohumeralis]|uniref:mucin-1-like n=1 Tax=Bactrocera neohumeralis TaxID=98809 RepID=UPI0021650406